MKTATKKAVALVSLLSLALMLTMAFTISANAAGSPLNVALNPVNGAKAGASGTATITDNGDGTMTVVIKDSGLEAGTHLAHIHKGSCTAEGPVVYPLSSVTVDNSGSGTSTTTVKAPVSALAGGSYYINVHFVGQGVPPGETCGNIDTSAIAASGSSSGSGSSAGGQGGASGAPTSAPATGFGGAADNSQFPVNIALIAVLAVVVAGSSFALARSRKSR